METLGAGKSTVTLEDLENTECIIVIGQNPGTNHPRMLTSLRTAKQRGAKIIAVNPLKEVALQHFKYPQDPLGIFKPATAIADIYLQLRINSDVALLKGLCKYLIEHHAEDQEFIAEYTDGFEAFSRAIAATGWDEICDATGVTRTAIEEAGRTIAETKTLVICWAMGLTQHRNAVDNIRELVNLLLIRGNVGKPNAGALCVRGHSNVQGDRTMGIWEKMDDAFLEALGREFSFNPPREHGLDVVATIEAMAAGRVKAFVSLGGNFLSATPDTHLVAQGLTQCNLTVGIGTKLNRFHLTAGKTALLLPCLGRTDLDRQESGVQTITVENTISWVSGSMGHLNPLSDQMRSEVAIVAGMAAATLGARSATDWKALTADYGRARGPRLRALQRAGA
jgi:molybdopterin-dependent oxidoreductase alpha subunit